MNICIYEYCIYEYCIYEYCIYEYCIYEYCIYEYCISVYMNICISLEMNVKQLWLVLYSKASFHSSLNLYYQ